MRLWCWFGRNRRDDELQEEIETHLAMVVRDRVERGEQPQAAEFAARREFGNRTLIQEVTREMWGGRMLREFWQDVRYAIRGMRGSPGFTAVAVVSLALGIGANTAIFSLLNVVMLRLLPVKEPGRLVELLQKYPGEPRGNGYWSLRSYEYFLAHNHVFSDILGTAIDNQIRLQSDGSADAIGAGEFVTPNYFELLGVQPSMGRPIEDKKEGVAVLSWACWQKRFHGHPDALGKKIIVQGQPATIVGIAPPAFTGLRVEAQTDVWQPLPNRPDTRLVLLARLKPTVTLAQVRAEMAVLYRFTIEERFARSKDPQVRQLKVEVEPAGAGLSTVRDRVGKPLIVLMGLVALLLLIACVNIANMLLARGASREREMALRVGLGASRGRLLRQMLTESLVLSAAGTVAAVFVAYFLTARLIQLLASGRPHERVLLRIEPDMHVLAFTIGVAVAVGLAFGIAPALNAFRTAPESALRQSASSGRTIFQRVFGRGLVAAQVALSVLLLSAGAVFLGHLWDLEHTDLGFQPDHVLLVTFDPWRSERLPSRYHEIVERIQRIPGVTSVSLGGPAPLSGAGASGFATAEGFEERPADRRWISICYVSPKYFKTLGIPLLAGRDFDIHDEAHWKVAIINRAFAKYYFAGRDPVGQHITLNHVTADPEVKTYRIIGVAGNANYYEIREAPPRTVYLPAFRDKEMAADHFILRTSVDPEGVAANVRDVVTDVLRTVPVLRTTTLTNQVDASIVLERLVATLSGAYGALGLLLASVGLYGLLAYTVARRTTEIGIRLALGANMTSITRMVLIETFAIVAVGLMVGAPLALLVSRFAGALIPDVALQTTGPITIGAGFLLLGALLASYVPARRAAHVDPIEALRHE
jgi:predicted permease